MLGRRPWARTLRAPPPALRRRGCVCISLPASGQEEEMFGGVSPRPSPAAPPAPPAPPRAVPRLVPAPGRARCLPLPQGPAPPAFPNSRAAATPISLPVAELDVRKKFSSSGESGSPPASSSLTPAVRASDSRSPIFQKLKQTSYDSAMQKSDLFSSYWLQGKH